MNLLRHFAQFAAVGAWLATIPLASAHRVDEYLQATRLSIDIERVDLEIDLTPGIALASTVLAWIDTNRDGEISNAEGEAYALEMLRSAVLKVDGWPVPVTLVETSFPKYREMSLGVGTIRIRATARIPAAAAGRHEISFLNMHRPESSVYLVNALVPANPRLQFADPRRDTAQHGLKLEYTVIADAPLDRTFALLAGLALAGCLFLRHGYALRDAVRASRARKV
jgi:hypothetical protein